MNFKDAERIADLEQQVERLRGIIENIDRLNREDDWDHSDLIAQEVISARTALSEGGRVMSCTCWLPYGRCPIHNPYQYPWLQTPATPARIGWKCPRCHKINAPFVAACNCKRTQS